MKPRITSHQRWALDRLRRLSRGGCWVRERDSGAPAALAHLHRKGYAERREVIGPRGGRSYEYRPLP